jgi:hypothetical protein
LLAFGLSIALFIFWAVVGLAVLAGLYREGDRLQTLLLAPVVGLATTTLGAFWLNWLGFPVASFGIGWALVLFLSSAALLWRSRPHPLSWREYAPFAGILFVALLLTGRPMLEFGFDWVSYANDDMANYCLAAQRLLNHGFFDFPDPKTIATGRDYSLFYWVLHVSAKARFGSELILAWICSWTGLTPDQAFMPTILAIHLILISTTAGLIYQAKQLYGVAFTATTLFSLSALNSLGTIFQLIAQVFGLSLMAGCLALLPALFPQRSSFPQLSEPEPLSRKQLISLISPNVVTSILLAALFVAYPEVLPFLFLSSLSYLLVRLIQRQIWIKPTLLLSGLTILLACAFANRYLFHLFSFLEAQTDTGVGQSKIGSFPYYLIPSGLADLWGLLSITRLASEPWLSSSILLGGLLLLGTAIGTIYLARLAHPAIITTSVMLTVAAILFIRRSDFGLFKIAMFLQPFLLTTLVMVWFRLTKRIWARAIPLILLGAIGLSTQNSYVELSRGITNRAAPVPAEVVNPSQAKINTTFRALIQALPPDQSLLLDTTNIMLAKLQALSTRGIVAAFLSRNFFAEGSSLPFETGFAKTSFDLHSQTRPTQNPFSINLMDKDFTNQKDHLTLVTTSGKQDIFNRRSLHFSPTENYKTIPLEQVRDHLVFTHSQLGKHYYLSGMKQVSYYQFEPDWFFPEQRQAGIGRHLLFQAMNPSPQPRLALTMTASLNNDKQNQLPPAEAIGTQRQPFGMIGRGSARIFSPPLTPQVIQGHPFLAIDMGIEGKRFSEKRKGLMRLYGLDVPRDQRKLVGFGRDISLISEADYANLKPPSAVKSFPGDLAHPDLEYSGVYEDGWISEAAFFTLKSSQPAPLLIQGMIPRIKNASFTTELTVLVEGQEISRQPLKLGEFSLKLAVPPSPNRQRIDLRFSNSQTLPAPDYRPVVAQLKFIGFKNG